MNSRHVKIVFLKLSTNGSRENGRKVGSLLVLILKKKKLLLKLEVIYSYRWLSLNL